MLIKKGLSKVYLIAIDDVYEGARTRVMSLCGETDDFTVSVRVHQCSALSPRLFSLEMDKRTNDIQYEVLWCTLFADDIYIVLVGDSLEVVNGRLEE